MIIGLAIFTIVWFTVGFFTTLYAVGKQRKPMSKVSFCVTVILNIPAVVLALAVLGIINL
jgi:ABC-type phosphate transport system permease subunit